MDSSAPGNIRAEKRLTEVSLGYSFESWKESRGKWKQHLLGQVAKSEYHSVILVTYNGYPKKKTRVKLVSAIVTTNTRIRKLRHI